jgi:hypothetical protein
MHHTQMTSSFVSCAISLRSDRSLFWLMRSDFKFVKRNNSGGSSDSDMCDS